MLFTRPSNGPRQGRHNLTDGISPAECFDRPSVEDHRLKRSLGRLLQVSAIWSSDSAGADAAM